MVINLLTERMFQVLNSFLLLFRMVHGFTCSGLTETQYVNSCKASRIGHVEQQYISTGNVIVLVYSLQNYYKFNYVNLLLFFVFVFFSYSLFRRESRCNHSIKY